MPDSILFWNAVALEANRISHTEPDKREQTGPTLSSRALAIVHLAMYDAYAGVANDPAQFPPYMPPPPALPAPGASYRDAVAGAAFTTLSALYKAQVPFFTAQLNAFNEGDPSFAFGKAVAEALLELRKNDPDARDCGYQPSLARGRHREDPDNPGQGFHAPFYGAQSKGFAITQRWPLNQPPFEDGAGNPAGEYIAALGQVIAEGIKPELMGTLSPARFPMRRTAQQTLEGTYWAYDGANRIGTPPRLYNQIIREIAMARGNSEADNARLFAFVNAAMGDAGILAWQHKYCFDLWRPVVGIREHDRAFGPATMIVGRTLDLDADPGWLPLGAPNTNMLGKNMTPPFPAYPSGHATFGAAAFHVTRLFYGIPMGHRSPDELAKKMENGVSVLMGFISDEFNGGSHDNTGTIRPRHLRSFPEGLWGMLIENARGRLCLGVHWIFDAFVVDDDGLPDLSKPIGGVRLGLDIAEDIYFNGNQPRRAPQMTPAGTALPPIQTPPPGSPMPQFPAEPAEVGGCAGNLRPGAPKKMVENEYPFGPQR